MSSQMWWRKALILSLLLILCPICEAFPLVAVINIEPLDNSDVQVRAHFGVIAPLPCPSLLDNVCNEGNSNCIAHAVSSPLRGDQPSPGWCVRQWQKIIPRQHSSNIMLGSNAGVTLSTRADLSVRKDKRKVNWPPFSALIPPVRVNVNCPRDISLSVYDLDGDKIRCRYARDRLGECHGNCPQHTFLLLDEVSCTLSYKGGASVGQYYVKLMVEDFPVHTPYVQMDQVAFSSNPIFLSITVEDNSADCSSTNTLPVFVDKSPVENAISSMLPYEEVNFNITIRSEVENVLEMAVVGPPGLYVSPLKDEGDSKKSVTLSWVRGLIHLGRLLSICFTANTNSLQSEIRCMWLLQRPMGVLPTGTELNCNNNRMSLVLPISSMADLPLDTLKLNDPSCAVTYNTTHVTASFSLTGCGTKIVHTGSELVYTNTLKSALGPSPITRRPVLILPLACRIKAQKAVGPSYRITIPEEEKVFGKTYFWVEFHLPGEGPFGNLTRNAKFRRLREAEPLRVNRLKELDMYVFSNSTMTRAQLMIGGCKESETEDFSDATSIVDRRCDRNNKSLEIIIQMPMVKVYRLDLSRVNPTASMMFVECEVNLCVTTQPSQKCPDACDPASVDSSVLVSKVESINYIVRSGPVSLLDQPVPVPTTTTTLSPQTATPTQATTITTSSASERSSIWAVEVTVVFHMFCLCLLH